MTMPNTGVDWVCPATDPDSMRVARARAGLRDYSQRVVTGEEIDQLLDRAQPAFRAMILLGINCGLGPADLGRLRWNMIDLERGYLNFPRPKTGVARVGYLWKKTRRALRRVRTLRHNRRAIERDGETSLVFLTRKNLPFYREVEVHGFVDCDGQRIRKLLHVKVDNPLLRTFRRMVRELGFDGLTFYRLRHSFRTFGQRARDREALDACMGHKDRGIGRVYDHEQVEWNRLRGVARVVYFRLWPKVKLLGGTQKSKKKMTRERVAAGEHGEAA
jgi:integrase